MLRNSDRYDILKRLEDKLHQNLQEGIVNSQNYTNWHHGYGHMESTSPHVHHPTCMLPKEAFRWPEGLAEHINRVAIATASHILDEVLTKREYQEAVKISYLNVLHKMTNK